MSRFKSACAALVLAASASGAFAQASPMASDSTSASTGAMASHTPMTKSQMATAQKCQAMSHDAMMKDAGCMKVLKAHPDAMKSDAMSAGAMGH